MKRIFLIAAVLLLPLAGCQRTPEAPIVAQKNTEKMIELARRDADTAAESGAPLNVQYGIPDGLAYSQTGAGGKLSILVDAAVVAPDTPLPIVRVKAAQFEQDTVTALWNAFIGDIPMYETSAERTKSEIAEDILYYKQVREGLIESAVEAGEAQEVIDALEAEYPSAPDARESVLADGRLKPLDQKAGGAKYKYLRFYGINAASADKQYYFSVRNDFDNDEVVEWDTLDADGNKTGWVSVNVMRSASMSAGYSGASGAYSSFGFESGMRKPERMDAAPEGAKLAVTPEQAVKMAEAFLEKVGLSEIMGVWEIFFAPDGAYEVDCSRRVGGIPCAVMLNVRSTGGLIGKNAYAPEWGYESLALRLDDDGVFDVSWSSPMEIIETVTTNAALKPFAQIEEIARKILPIRYEARAKDEYIHRLAFTFDRVELSLHRVSEQNRFDQGLLVPVWNFFGTKTEYRGKDGSDFWSEYGTFLSINAIDGTVIDVSQGY